MRTGIKILGSKANTITAHQVNRGIIKESTYKQIREYESKLKARESRLRYRAKKAGVKDFKGIYGNVSYNYRGDWLGSENDARKYLKQIKSDYNLGAGTGSFKGGEFTPSALKGVMPKIKDIETSLQDRVKSFNEQGDKLRRMAGGSSTIQDVKALKGEELNIKLTGYKDYGKAVEMVNKMEERTNPREKMNNYKQNYSEALRVRADELSFGDEEERRVAEKLNKLASEIDNMTDEKFGAHWLAGNIVDIKEWYKLKTAEGVNETMDKLTNNFNRMKDVDEFNVSYDDSYKTPVKLTKKDTAKIKQYLRGYKK